MICPHCCKREALRNVGLCRSCASAQERADRRERPSYYHARSLALRIDTHDVRRAGEVWAKRPARIGPEADSHHALIDTRCVATLDGVRWSAGVIVAVERGAGQAGRAYRPEATAFWVWLLKPHDELAFPALRFEREMVEVVRRERIAEVSEA